MNIGLALGFAVAFVMTFLDWRLNPSGIFHNAEGTNWGFVADTAVSWFVPVAMASSGVAAVVLFVLARRKN